MWKIKKNRLPSAETSICFQNQDRSGIPHLNDGGLSQILR